MDPTVLRHAAASFALTIGLVLGVTVSRAHAQAAPVPMGASTAAITGRITDVRNLPIVGAVITARGPTVGWTATVHDGSFRLNLPAGSYEILVRKGGYTPGALPVVLAAGSTESIALVLSEANLSSVNIGTARSGANLPFNIGVSATATLADAAISEHPELTERDVALELPGVTLAHPAESVPDTSFVVRGGTDETRVQIDGHGVNAGATGRWNSSYASQPLFDSIEVVKGAGVSGANAGESVFGTVNLRTRDFAPRRQADLVMGTDSFGGNFSTFAVSGNAFQNDRLSYVLEHNVYGYNGPQAGRIANNAVAEPDGTALLADRNVLSSPLMLGSDLAKLRWRFTGSTSLTVGFIGVHSKYFESGGAFGVFLGQTPYNALAATTTIPVNAPLERNYGLELSLAHAPATGLGYRLAATFQRAFLDQLPASFFFAPSSLVDGKQLDGSTSIPYTHVYGELNFRHRSGFVGSLAADYTGANNWTNGPAFTVWSSMLRCDLRRGYRAQFSIENLFDHNTGTQYANGLADGGYSAVNYGAQASGALPTYGISPTTRFAIAPRTFRFQVEAHVGS